MFGSVQRQAVYRLDFPPFSGGPSQSKEDVDYYAADLPGGLKLKGIEHKTQVGMNTQKSNVQIAFFPSVDFILCSLKSYENEILFASNLSCWWCSHVVSLFPKEEQKMVCS